MTAPELIVSCAVRATKAADGTISVSVIDDGPHRPYGVLDVIPITNGFRVYHEPLEALGDAQSGPDETLALLEVIPGPSWGLEYVDVYLARNGARVPLSTMAVPYANAWVHLTGYRKAAA